MKKNSHEKKEIMNTLLKNFLPENRIKAVVGVGVAVLLLAFMIIFGVDGSKHYVLGAALCAGTGYLVSLGKWNVK